MESLAYLGFNVAYGSQVSALTVTRDKRMDWQTRSTQRTAFHVHVIGPKDAGKVCYTHALACTQVTDGLYARLSWSHIATAGGNGETECAQNRVQHGARA
jgi:hypothetical protein